MATITDSQKNGFCDSTYFTSFVQSHRATLEYLLKFGNVTEQAKASLIMELAEGVGDSHHLSFLIYLKPLYQIGVYLDVENNIHNRNRVAYPKLNSFYNSVAYAIYRRYKYYGSVAKNLRISM